jgi:glutathione synthase/RimK-type ligase-like ATP-grasp enzyme
VVLLTDYRGALRQKLQPWESLDLVRVGEGLREEGWTVREVRLEEVANGLVQLVGADVVATSTQDAHYRPFVDDVLFTLSRDNRLIPRYELFRAHENKGYQELLRRKLGLEMLPSLYLGNLAGLDVVSERLRFPLVFKRAAGYQSAGVALVRDRAELARLVMRCNRPRGLLRYRAKQLIKRYVLRGRYFPEMYTDCPYSGGYVLQEYLPGADGDWKVLVYGERYYVLRRDVRPGDFRASGSGRFRFEAPPDHVLDFARAAFERLDTPTASLDIVAAGGRCALLEFQAVHFGTYTVQKAPHWFEAAGEGWRRIPERTLVEREFARAVAWYLRRPARE